MSFFLIFSMNDMSFLRQYCHAVRGTDQRKDIKLFNCYSQQLITYLKSTIETVEKVVKYSKIIIKTSEQFQ